ncbi:cytosine/adenosine deaminase-related metal-dependent hydrolase [Bradyrhizobium sp. GM22.5]
MTRLHFASALLPSGWANDVQVVITAGAIAEVTPGMAPVSGDERHDIAFPGLASLHSHAFQRGMAGLAELRGDSTDTFWTWRETMYRFALAMTPDDVAAVATLLYVEMLEQGFTRVGEFHYLHHDRDGSPYARHRRNGRTHRAGRRSFGYCADAAAEFLCAWLIWGRSTACRPAPLHLYG